MIPLDRRIDNLVELGVILSSVDVNNNETCAKAKSANPWFTYDNIQKSIKAISEKFLKKEVLEEWTSKYDVDNNGSQKAVGIVMAGNIPLVGFHDLMCVLIAGQKAQIKLSDKDTVLMEWIVKLLRSIDSNYEESIIVANKLSDFDAVIATGSDSASSYFTKYFSNYPHIIRKNRHAVGVILNTDDLEKVAGIGNDIFDYFGLGCRNISKLYLQEGVDLDLIFQAINEFEDIKYHNKYKNNYDYNQALFLLNKEEFYSNDFLHLKQDDNISSRIASVHYSYFNSVNLLKEHLDENNDNIQCVASSEDLVGIDTVRFGKTQQPNIDDYADGVDTLEFLSLI